MISLRRVLPLLGALSLVGARAARADELAPPAPAIVQSPPAHGDWYGGTILALDGALIVSSLGCVALTEKQACLLPLYGYGLGGPIIHGRHRGWGRALASVALRGGLPTLGALIGASGGRSCKTSGENDYCGLDALAGAAVGALIGAAAAIAIDSAWAFDDAPTAPPRGVALAPSLSLSPGGGGVGIVGRF
jgi:hypothetical protein